MMRHAGQGRGPLSVFVTPQVGMAGEARPVFLGLAEKSDGLAVLLQGKACIL